MEDRICNNEFFTEKIFLSAKVDMDDIPHMTVYHPAHKKSDCAILIFPGGGYKARAAHEGKPISEFFTSQGNYSPAMT